MMLIINSIFRCVQLCCGQYMTTLDLVMCLGGGQKVIILVYTCNDEPYSEALESKIGFINHRAYLPMEHRWRHSRLHNGLSEKRKRSLELQVGKI